MRVGFRFAVFATVMAPGALAWTEELPVHRERPCAQTVDRFFADEVWAKVGAQKCLTCHKAGGDAEDSKFVLRDPEKSQGGGKADVLRHNHEAFVQMAKLMEGEQYKLLVKVTGGLEHGGEKVLEVDSTGYKILAEFVRRANAPAAAGSSDIAAIDTSAPPFFAGVVMLDDVRLLRRLTLSLAGRLPTTSELELSKAAG